MMIDTHCHLTDGKFNDVDGVIARAIDAGVSKMIVPATDLSDVWAVKELTERYESVYGLAGIYPGNVEQITDLNKALKEIEQMVTNNKKILGIGEIGLDCYWNERGIDKQRKFFKAQLELAAKNDWPVVIHTRKSEKEIKEVFLEMDKLPRGQFHCLGESVEFLEYILSLGFYVSYCGNVTYKNAQHIRDLLLRTPLDRLLFETDAPYLPPEGKRGTINEPANVKITADFEARLLGKSISELEEITTKNAKCLFSDI